MSFSERLKIARTQKGLSKSQLAEEVGVHYSQIGRYENKGAIPSADVLQKITNTLEVSADYLLNGTTENLADNTLTDKELLNQFKTIEQFPDEDKNVIKILLDAFITKRKVQKLAQ